jgi:Mg-chelatase subunit ChlD
VQLTTEGKLQNPQPKQVNNILATIEPYIYGGTPMCAALESATGLFHSVSADDKALFILSDGEASDGDPTVIASQLKAME